MRTPVRLRGSLGIRLVALLAGIFACAVGIVAPLKAGLGLGAWAVLAQGISQHMPLSFGNTTIAISLFVLAFAWRLGAQLGFGTIADALLVGLFIDLLNSLHWVRQLASLSLSGRVGLLALGLVSFSFGSALYIAAGFGGGPRDALMLAIWRRSGRRIAYSRALLELSVLLAGFVLGGTVGVGTLVLATLVGPCLQTPFSALVRVRLADRVETLDPPLKQEIIGSMSAS